MIVELYRLLEAYSVVYAQIHQQWHGLKLSFDNCHTQPLNAKLQKEQEQWFSLKSQLNDHFYLAKGGHIV